MKKLMKILPLVVLPVTCGVSFLAVEAQEKPTSKPAEPTIVETIQEEATKLEPLVTSELARGFLEATAKLPAAQARVLYRQPGTRSYVPSPELEKLSPEDREQLERVELPASRYYITKYGSPLAYARAVDLVGEAGWKSWDGKRVVDFGYGTVGHLRLLALGGAEVVGVDVDSFLVALYGQSGDQGKLGPGSVRLVNGFWPADEATKTAVGAGFDFFLSKNTLKRGYIHPEREADPRSLIQLGVDDRTFLRELHRVLKPGGLAMIYNLCPKQAPPEEKFIPWADGRSPFEREEWEQAGFEVLAFDVDDGPAARAQGRALGWETEDRSLGDSLFATYTLARRRP